MSKITPLVLTEKKVKTDKEQIVYTLKQMQSKAASKLSEFGLTQDSLLSVSHLEGNEDKSGVLGVIVKGFVKDGNSLKTLMINFYDNGNISYRMSHGKADDRIIEVITKDEFAVYVNSLTDSEAVYDNY